jgi:hypothetical protein
MKKTKVKVKVANEREERWLGIVSWSDNVSYLLSERSNDKWF